MLAQKTQLRKSDLNFSDTSTNQLVQATSSPLWNEGKYTTSQIITIAIQTSQIRQKS